MKKWSVFILFLYFFLNFSFVFGQIDKVDSVVKKIQSFSLEEKNSNEYVELLYDYQKLYLASANYDSIYNIALEAKRIAGNLNDKYSICLSEIMLARFYSVKKNYKKALLYYKKSRGYIRKSKNANKLLFNCDSEIGTCFFKINKLDSALKYYKNTVVHSGALSLNYKAKSYNQLSLVYLMKNEFDSSKIYIQKINELGQNDLIDLYFNLSMLDYYEFKNDSDSSYYYCDKTYKLIRLNSAIIYEFKVWALIKIANNSYHFFYDKKAKKYFEEALTLVVKNQDLLSYVKIFGPLNFILTVEGELDEAIRLCQEAINWGHKVNDSSLIAQAMYNSTFVYGKLKNYTKSIQIYEELINEFDMYLPVSKYEAYTNLSFNHYENHEYLKALEYGYLAKQPKPLTPTSLYNLADALLVVYNDTVIPKKEILKIINKYSKEEILAKDLQEELLKQAFENYSKSIELIKQEDNKRSIIHPYYGLGDYYEIIDNNEAAASFYEKSWDASMGTDMMELDNKIKIAKKLYKFYRNDKKEISKALKWIEVLDSLKTEESESKNLEFLGRKQAEFEYSQKIYTDSIELVRENEINSLKESQKDKQRLLIYLFSFLLILILVVIMYLFFRRKELKTENNLIHLEQKLLRTQMNPHFIFNSLTTIGGYIISNRVNESYNYISQFSRLIRLILESSRKDEIFLSEEITIINNFLSLHQMNKKEELKYDINYNENIVDKDIKLPPMLLQPFIENAIKYGVNHETNICQVNIDFKLIGDALYCSVRDFGRGFENANNNDRTSYSIQITKERIENIKKQTGKEVKLNILDFSKESNKENGVLVEIFVQV